jgi:hypothetical protein
VTADVVHATLRPMLKLGVLPLVLLAGMPGCGGGGSGGGADGASRGGGSLVSCVVTESSGGAAIVMICEEGTGLYADQIRAACSRPPADAAVAPHADITNAPCPRANALGGCTITTGAGSFTGWYYSDGVMTSEDIAMLCASTGQTFVTPS